jgi:hypothetical protein
MTDPKQDKPAPLPAIELPVLESRGARYKLALVLLDVETLDEFVRYADTGDLSRFLEALDAPTRAAVLEPWVKPERDERHAAINEMAKARGLAIDAQSSRDMLVWLQDDAAEERGGQFADLWTQLKAAVRRVKEAESRATRAEARVAELEVQLYRAELHAVAEAVRAVCALPDNPSADAECETVRELSMAMKRLLDTKREALARIAELEKR